MDRISIPDATPQIVLEYQSNDEQAMLARVRYNRLVDTFTGLTAYELQGHFRAVSSWIYGFRSQAFRRFPAKASIPIRKLKRNLL